jgi:uncharacterized membrane protein YesL
MGTIWGIIKQSAADFWDEFLYLMIFNAVWLLGSLLVLPWPYLTFALFFTAHEIGQGKAIKFSTFFMGAVPFWKQAYIWGVINLLTVFILWFNLNFYANFGTGWAAIVQIIFLAMIVLWVVLQIVALPMYPRLEEPGFKTALRNAGILLGRYPHVALVLIMIVALFVNISSLFPLFAFFGAGAFTAILANRAVATLLERELGRDM